VARYSYGVYVFHWILFFPLARMFLPLVSGWSPNAAAVSFFLYASFVSLALAVLSYHGYEAFFLSLKGGLTRRRPTHIS
jgi:peptidoglycan/LPS O-acetylase OafA/YrhL